MNEQEATFNVKYEFFLLLFYLFLSVFSSSSVWSLWSVFICFYLFLSVFYLFLSPFITIQNAFVYTGLNAQKWMGWMNGWTSERTYTIIGGLHIRGNYCIERDRPQHNGTQLQEKCLQDWSPQRRPALLGWEPGTPQTQNKAPAAD